MIKDHSDAQFSSQTLRSREHYEGKAPAALGPILRSTCAGGKSTEASNNQTYWFLL